MVQVNLGNLSDPTEQKQNPTVELCVHGDLCSVGGTKALSH